MTVNPPPTDTAIKISTQQLARGAVLLRAGQKVLLSGEIFTARDAAHKIMVGLLEAGSALPFDIKGACLYYCGPTPAPPGKVIGSCGPTTSSRMDRYTPALLAAGMKAVIGKGPRSREVCDALKEHQAVYLCAIGGAGALAAKSVMSCRVIAFPQLGCESVKRLTVEELPLIVAVDTEGGNIYQRTNPGDSTISEEG